MEITMRFTVRGGGEEWFQYYISVSRKRDLRAIVNQSTTRKRDIKDELKQHEAVRNNLCKTRLIACQDNCSPDFTLARGLCKLPMENDIKNYLLSLIYFFNTKAQIVMKTPFGQCEPFICPNVVRQGTVLGPVLNNCSLDKFSKESYPYYYVKTEDKITGICWRHSRLQWSTPLCSLK